MRRCLGEGGTGIVYEAFDREKQCPVALKLLHVEADAATRLHAELAAVRGVAHTNLVGLGELVEDDGRRFLTMELVVGDDFVAHVRPQGRLDEPRLRAGLAQLTSGLMALHAAGLVHRDVKPSNVKITREGRLVLLDFGLVAEADRAPGAGLSEAEPSGTLVYMAPEQALGRAVGPEADWYSVGVMLYEALVGRLPVEGSSLQVVIDKQRLEPPAPRAHIAELPADLDRICTDLMRFEPARRASGRSVLRRLGVGRAAEPGPPSPFLPPSTHTRGAIFVGREAELGLLAAALADVRAGRPIAVHVSGEPGIGKSALLRHFVADARATRPDLMLLVARCPEEPLGPYSGIGALVEALAQRLERLPPAEVATLVPPHAALLVECFPTLRRVAALADAPAQAVLDPQERRMLVFAALRELVRRLGERVPLVLLVDDVQHADADALALLGELLRAPDAGRFLLVTTWHAPEAEAASVRARLAELPGEHRGLALAPLPGDAGSELAALLLAAHGAPAAGVDAERLALAAAGHPLHLEELARAGATQGALAELLAARLARLDATQRRLLDLLAVAGAPLRLEPLARSVGLEVVVAQRQLAALEVAGLVASQPDAGTVELAQRALRALLLGALADDERAARHRELARHLEGAGRGSAHQLFHHVHAGGQREAAALHAGRAAEQAVQALAFEQAARLLARAVELLPDEHPSRRALELARADALAHAGQGEAAARAYLEIAGTARGAEALELKHRAAQQLLVAGHIDEAIATMRAFLDEEGVPYPRTPVAALFSILGSSVRLYLGGSAPRTSRRPLASARELVRLDACYHAAVQLYLVDSVRATALSLRGVRLARRLGEPYRLARALAIEAGWTYARGGAASERGLALLASAEALARTVDHPHALAIVDSVRAQCTFFGGGFRTATEQCQAAEQVLSERCLGAGHELKVMRLWSCGALRFLGEYVRLARRTSEVMHECRQRGDLHGVSSVRTSDHPFVQLAADEPSRAREDVRDALRSWPTSGFRVHDYFAMCARTAISHYEDDPMRAFDELRAGWPALRRSLLLQVQFVRIVMFHDRAVAALAVAHAASPAERRRLSAAAEADLRRVAREAVPWAAALAALGMAQLAALRGDAVLTRARLEAAIAACDAADMAAHAAAARRRLGLLVGGDEGATLVTGADAWMRAQDVRRPERMAVVLTPGFAS